MLLVSAVTLFGTAPSLAKLREQYAMNAGSLPDAADRTAERQRAEIRALLGFREAGIADAEALGAWLTVLHGSGSRAHRPLPRPGSGDADGLRASQLQHAVERVDADVDLGGAVLSGLAPASIA